MKLICFFVFQCETGPSQFLESLFREREDVGGKEIGGNRERSSRHISLFLPRRGERWRPENKANLLLRNNVGKGDRDTREGWNRIWKQGGQFQQLRNRNKSTIKTGKVARYSAKTPAFRRTQKLTTDEKGTKRKYVINGSGRHLRKAKRGRRISKWLQNDGWSG